jgi:hypothetical protein
LPETAWVKGLALAVWGLVAWAAWRSPHRRLALLGAGWFLGATLLFSLTGTCSRRVYYTPTLGGLLVIGAALVHTWRRPLGAILGLAWLVTLVHGSPAVVRYTQWGEIADASERWRDLDFWRRLPLGAHVWLAERPFRADLDPRTFRLWGGRGRSLHHGAPAYALQAWLDEVLPERRLVLSTLTGTALRLPVDQQEVSVDVDGVSLVVRHHGAERQRWEIRSPFTVDADGPELRITPTGTRPGLVVVVWTPEGPVGWRPGSRELER